MLESLQNSIYKIALVTLLALSPHAFQLAVIYNPRSRSNKILAHKNISGSFFNPIPPNRDDGEENNNMKSNLESFQNHRADSTSESSPSSSLLPLDPFDQSLAELLKKKKDTIQNTSTKTAPSVNQIMSSAKALGKKTKTMYDIPCALT